MPTVDYGLKVEREVERIRKSGGLTGRDREILLRYWRDLEAEGLSKGRIFKVLIHTRKHAEELGGRSLADASEDDIKDLVVRVQRRDLAESTKCDYREILKRFFKWLNGGDCPKKARWIKTTKKRGNGKLPEHMLTEDDVEKLIGAARNPRNRAMIAVEWETGARPGEFLDMRVGDIEERKHGKKVVVDGKTGPRRLPLVSSVPHLNAWISQHPAGGDPRAPLWCRLDGHPRERIDYDYFRKLLREIAGRAGVGKPMRPYQFRHSRATYLANWLTEAQMCEYFGWVQGSDRPRTYVHLSGRDIDLAYDRMHGFVPRDEGRPTLSPRECPRCGEMNGARGKFCYRCGLPLDFETAVRIQEDEKIAGALYAGDVKVVGGLEDLVERMVEKRLKEILGGKYSPK